VLLFQNGCVLFSISFLPILIIYFFLFANRVSLGPVGFAPVSGACGAPILTVAAGGGGPAVAPPPGPRFQSNLKQQLFEIYIWTKFSYLP
jgi:hypothetical protein